MDDFFLYNICHTSEYELLGANDITKAEFMNEHGVHGHHSSYTYSLESETYCEDLITMSVGQVVIYYKVMSRPKFEAKTKLEYIVNSVKKK
ncbi:MAG: hypothetical protein IPM74_03000 [Crocinitomicaceae bacterium]|nr:hypothetical protein [Crocinitomicaceae bacterium]MBK8924885.1 hypothetical protein [Crocinitomicaceae bacterium]